MKPFIIALALVVISTSQLRAGFVVPDATAKAVGAVNDDTYKLYQTVTGAQWDYIWHRTTVQIAFGPDGHITHGPWGQPAWRITGPHTIAIQPPSNRPGLGEMIINFSPELTRWTCKDWSGDRAVGIRRKPEATPSK